MASESAFASCAGAKRPVCPGRMRSRLPRDITHDGQERERHGFAHYTGRSVTPAWQDIHIRPRHVRHCLKRFPDEGYVSIHGCRLDHARSVSCSGRIYKGLGLPTPLALRRGGLRAGRPNHVLPERQENRSKRRTKAETPGAWPRPRGRPSQRGSYPAESGQPPLPSPRHNRSGG